MIKGQTVLFLALCVSAIYAAPQFRYKPQWRYDEIEFHYNNPSPYKTGAFDPFNINQDYGRRIEPVHYSPVNAIADDNHVNDVEHVFAVHEDVPSSVETSNDSLEEHDSHESIDVIAAVHDEPVENVPVVATHDEPVAVHFVPVVSHVSSSSDDSEESDENEAVLSIDVSSVFEEKESDQDSTPTNEGIADAVETFEGETVQAIENVATKIETEQVVVKSADEDTETTTEFADILSNVFIRNIDENVPAAAVPELNTHDQVIEVKSKVVEPEGAESTDAAEDVTASSLQEDEVESSGDSQADENNVINEFVKGLVDLVNGNSIIADATEQATEESTDVPDFVVAVRISSDADEHVLAVTTDVPELTEAIRKKISDDAPVESETERNGQDESETEAAFTDSVVFFRDVDQFEFNPIADDSELTAETTTENV